MRRLALALLLLLPAAAAAQQPARPPSPEQQLEDSRRRLDEIKAERDRLESQRQQLQSQAHDVADELDNIERQRQSTNRIVNEIERQIAGLSTQLDQASAELVLAQNNLAERRAVLERRLVDIYKRGPLYTFQVLLTAESFGDLLSRYKYLYLTSRQDRALVGEVEVLKNRVTRQRNEILTVRNQLDQSRQEREAEVAHYADLARQSSSKLSELQASARRTDRRIAALERDQSRLVSVLAGLERARRESAARARANPGAARPAAPEAPAITTADLGRLDWPVDGRIVYQFGRDTLPSGGVIRWNGIGIAAPVGTPVHAVAAGRVRMVGQFGTYGLTIILEHGNGYYSIYAHLERALVRLDQSVARGATLGTVGGANSDYGPHLHFEIRGEDQQALDPTEWLRRR